MSWRARRATRRFAKKQARAEPGCSAASAERNVIGSANHECSAALAARLGCGVVQAELPSIARHDAGILPSSRSGAKKSIAFDVAKRGFQKAAMASFALIVITGGPLLASMCGAFNAASAFTEGRHAHSSTAVGVACMTHCEHGTPVCTAASNFRAANTGRMTNGNTAECSAIGTLTAWTEAWLQSLMAGGLVILENDAEKQGCLTTLL
jgi:hypothetical protein